MRDGAKRRVDLCLRKVSRYLSRRDALLFFAVTERRDVSVTSRFEESVARPKELREDQSERA